MDLTIVYGDDQDTVNRLRTRSGGQMITNPGNVLPVTPNCQQQPCYFLGELKETDHFIGLLMMVVFSYR